MNGTQQQSDTKRQHLLERLLDAVKQCQIRFGGRKEIATDSDSRVICLCAQFEAVLQHGLRKTRGLALTAAALKQAAGFTSKTEGELTFWQYVKESLSRHEVLRFYSLSHIVSDVGRGRSWLRCSLNEHSLERSLISLLADTARLGPGLTDCRVMVSVDSSPGPAVVSSPAPTPGLPDSMSVVELRQAIVAMMNRKDELEEQNTSLRSLLDGEMEHSAALRQDSELQKKKLCELEERHSAKVQALARENEVLKVQLKKYVGAVQMLKREGNHGNEALSVLRASEDSPPVLHNKFMGDIEELAAGYERKLIEVAEMHGELIEFNERLYRSLMAKDHLIVQMRHELIDLRGPVPGDLSQTSDDPSLSDFETAHRALINVWIPSVFLQGRAANAYHVYQVYIRILDNEWNVYRRYTEFRELHNQLKTQFPQVETFNFPPKKALGNKDSKFVEQRRKQLQCYLRTVMNKLIQSLPEFSSRPTKETLLSLLPFCIDSPQTNEGGAKTPRSKTSSRFPRLGRTRNQETRPEPQSGDL